MFLGEYKHILTKGNRLALPSRIRMAIIGAEVILSRGFEKCIFGYARETWEKMADLELEKPISTEEGRKVRRQIFSGALPIDVDQQGRLVVPQGLLDYAGITGKILIIGAGDHFEIWAESVWEDYRKEIEGNGSTR